jgi:Fic family protein
MVWNWQLNNWPNFTWDAKKIEQYEALFLLKSGVILGSSQHISEDDKQELFVELLSSEAMDTSLIEGEYLNRESVQSSIKKALGLSDTHYAISRKEQNIASMMVNLYQTLTLPITKASLCDWHQRLLAGNQRIEVLGEYRTHLETMEIVSGPDYAKKIHFIAPPSETVNREMAIFIQWG